jgi:hypothetical protein
VSGVSGVRRVVVSLQEFRAQRSVIATARDWNSEQAAVRVAEIDQSEPTEDQVTTTAADLYPNPDDNSVLSRALSLLKESVQILDDAEGFVQVNELMSADDAIQRFTALLPELFMCRSLGDSFATVVLALFYGIRNLKGMPASGSQITEIRLAIRQLLMEPFLVYEEAIRLTSKLELTGMSIDPPALPIIEDLLVG